MRCITNLSCAGGWFGFPSGGTIFQGASYQSTQNVISLNAVYKTLLVFIGCCGVAISTTTVSVNNESYSVVNLGNNYGYVGAYTAIIIENNTSDTLLVEFPVSCSSYVSCIAF